jgi:hypothetical protein
MIELCYALLFKWGHSNLEVFQSLEQGEGFDLIHLHCCYLTLSLVHLKKYAHSCKYIWNNQEFINSWFYQICNTCLLFIIELN